MQNEPMGITGERVVPYDLGIEWEPNTSDPVLMQHGVNALLAVDPYFDDDDRRLVVIRLGRCQGVWLGYPNDEGISGHRFYRRGLSDCLWSGEVFESEWIESIVTMASAHRRFSRDHTTKGAEEVASPQAAKETLNELLSFSSVVLRSGSYVVKEVTPIGEIEPDHAGDVLVQATVRPVRGDVASVSILLFGIEPRTIASFVRYSGFDRSAVVAPPRSRIVSSLPDR
jgi:hypothetical protein